MQCSFQKRIVKFLKHHKFNRIPETWNKGKTSCPVTRLLRSQCGTSAYLVAPKENSRYLIRRSEWIDMASQDPNFLSSSGDGVKVLVRSDGFTAHDRFFTFTQVRTSSKSRAVAQGDKRTSVTSLLNSIRRRLHS
jgi:hypothetical protein